MTLHILAPRRSAQVLDMRTRRELPAASAAQAAQHQDQRLIAHLDALAAACLDADNTLLAVHADLARLYEVADETDAESCVVRRAIIRRAAQAIMRCRYQDAMPSAEMAGGVALSPPPPPRPRPRPSSPPSAPRRPAGP
jgi:hypothetical protein